MKRRWITIWVLILMGTTAIYAQPNYPPSNLDGQSLRTWLQSNWYTGERFRSGYNSARRRMYNYIDNKNNKIEDMYSGYLKNWNYGGSGTNPSPINAEHVVPQSFFGASEPMRSDIHHLFPVHQSANSSRGSNPFGEINDTQTSKWWLNGSSRTSIPSSNINNYSEAKSGMFEPKESVKGNVARAVFYFYTVYPTQAGPISMAGDINVLYQWHLQDPVDGTEAARNSAIESYQGNRNPFVDHPELVARAWGFSTGGGGGGGGGSSNLFISEYVEGSSYNKAIEIVNLTGSSVNLSNYSFKKQTNGSGSWSSSYNLSGTLGNGDVYVVSNSSASSSLRNLADATTSSSVFSFNGNDPIGLFNNNSLIDIVGNFNGGSSYFASNVTKRRKSSVDDPSTSYTTSEWDNYSSNTFGGVGSHSSNKTALAESVLSPMEGVQVYPNPFSGRLTVELPNETAGEAVVHLMDMTGRTLLTGQHGDGQLELSTADLAPGIYLLQIQLDGVVQSHKLVKH